MRLAPRRVLVSHLVGLALLAPAIACGPSTPPERWSRVGNALPDYEVVIDTATVHGGRGSLRITALDEPDGFAGVMARAPAKGLEGRRVRVSAVLRTTALGGQGAALWARADDEARRTQEFASTQGHRPIVGTLPWTPVVVDVDVPAGARWLVFGALAAGRGTLWVDDVRVESLDAGATPTAFPGADTAGALRYGFDKASVLAPLPPSSNTPAPSPREEPRPLGARGLENLVAFTQLLGYVRCFHPADEALQLNWDDFAVRGVRAVEGAPDADSLVTVLRTLFVRVAPTVAVYRAGTVPPPAPVPPLSSASDLGVVFWRHYGFGVPGSDDRNVYSSTRVRVPAPAGRPLASIPVLDRPGTGADSIPVPDPRQPLRVDLGGGVAASIPLAVYTRMSSLPEALRSARPRPAAERFSARDRATRLADVALLWSVLQHFYPYFDVVGTDWPAALRRALSTAAVDRGPDEFQQTLERMVTALHDGHGRVYRATGTAWIPDVRFAWVEGRIVITAAGDSAAAAGVRRGDELVAIDGRPAPAALHELEARVSGATPQWIRYLALMRLAEGAPGSAVALRLRDPRAPGSAAREVLLTRAVNQPPSETRPDKIAELRPGIFYVDFDRITDADFTNALPRLERATAIVFDMRGYPRQVNTRAILAMLTDSTLRSARFEIPLVPRPDRAEMLFRDVGWSVPPAAKRLRAKAVFLTGGGAISYAETTMGIVEAFRLGPIVGAATAGTNGNVNPLSLPGGYSVSWTGMRVRKHDGSRHHGVGIRPTVPAEPTLQGVREGRDEVLERALAIAGASAPR